MDMQQLLQEAILEAHAASIATGMLYSVLAEADPTVIARAHAQVDKLSEGSIYKGEVLRRIREIIGPNRE